MMAIVNRTPDSFFDKGATWAEDKALARARRAGRGRRRRDRRQSAASRPPPASRSTPPRRRRASSTSSAQVRAEHPDLVISVDTWRARGRPGGLRGRRRRAQRRLGRGRPDSSTPPPRPAPRDLHPHRRRDAAHPPFPGGVRRPSWPPRSPTTPWAYADRAVAAGVTPAAWSSTPPTTRQEHLPLPRGHPAHRRDVSTPVARCWCRCRTRTSWGSRSTSPSASDSSAPWPPPRWRRRRRADLPARTRSWRRARDRRHGQQPCSGVAARPERSGAAVSAVRGARTVVLVPGGARAAPRVRRDRRPGRGAPRGVRRGARVARRRGVVSCSWPTRRASGSPARCSGGGSRCRRRPREHRGRPRERPCGRPPRVRRTWWWPTGRPGAGRRRRGTSTSGPRASTRRWGGPPSGRRGAP